jgi:hypothetical protein
MRGDERMDELIDAALRSYAEPGEIPAARVVAARVMERARSEGRRFGWWGWGVAAACLLVALVGAMLMMRGARVPEIAWVPRAPGVSEAVRRAEAEAHPSSSANTARLKLCPDIEACEGDSGSLRAMTGLRPGGRTGVGRRLIEAQTVTTLPKMEVFPTPRPLTAEEQTLMAFTEQATPTVKKQFVEGEKHLGDPIAIAELKIRPLDEKDRE